MSETHKKEWVLQGVAVDVATEVPLGPSPHEGGCSAACDGRDWCACPCHGYPPEVVAEKHPYADIRARVPGHPAAYDPTDRASCQDDECLVCGLRDCPHGEPLHYHHDGCPACWLDPTPLDAAARRQILTDAIFAWSRLEPWARRAARVMSLFEAGLDLDQAEALAGSHDRARRLLPQASS